MTNNKDKYGWTHTEYNYLRKVLRNTKNYLEIENKFTEMSHYQMGISAKSKDEIKSAIKRLTTGNLNYNDDHEPWTSKQDTFIANKRLDGFIPDEIASDYMIEFGKKRTAGMIEQRLTSLGFPPIENEPKEEIGKPEIKQQKTEKVPTKQQTESDDVYDRITNEFKNDFNKKPELNREFNSKTGKRRYFSEDEDKVIVESMKDGLYAGDIYDNYVKEFGEIRSYSSIVARMARLKKGSEPGKTYVRWTKEQLTLLKELMESEAGYGVIFEKKEFESHSKSAIKSKMYGFVKTGEVERPSFMLKRGEHLKTPNKTDNGIKKGTYTQQVRDNINYITDMEGRFEIDDVAKKFRFGKERTVLYTVFDELEKQGILTKHIKTEGIGKYEWEVNKNPIPPTITETPKQETPLPDAEKQTENNGGLFGKIKKVFGIK